MSEAAKVERRGKMVTSSHDMPASPDCMEMWWGERQILSWRAQESLNCRLTSPEGEQLIGIGLARVAHDGAGALIQVVRPDFARTFAAELLQHADAIDGGKGKQ